MHRYVRTILWLIACVLVYLVLMGGGCGDDDAVADKKQEEQIKEDNICNQCKALTCEGCLGAPYCTNKCGCDTCDIESSCSIDSQCDGNETCSGQTCGPVVCVNAGNGNQTNATNQTVYNHQCKNKCTTDADCNNSTQACKDSVCLDKCTTSSSCRGDEVCTSNICVALECGNGTVAIDHTCKTATELPKCGNLVCEDVQCTLSGCPAVETNTTCILDCSVPISPNATLPCYGFTKEKCEPTRSCVWLPSQWSSTQGQCKPGALLPASMYPACGNDVCEDIPCIAGKCYTAETNTTCVKDCMLPSESGNPQICFNLKAKNECIANDDCKWRDSLWSTKTGQCIAKVNVPIP